MAFFSTYPYLLMSLTLLVIFLLCYLAGGKQRRPMLLSALLSAPFGFLSVHFVPVYWNPVRIAEFGAGIEDIIFSFSNGGIVWFMVTLPVRNRLLVDIHTKRVLLRYGGCSVVGLSLGIIPLSLGYDPMHVSLAGISIMGIALLLLRREFWRLSVVGTVSFGLLYTIICIASFLLNPDFLRQWNLEALTGYIILGVPVEEIIWSIAFGAVWPLIAAYSFETRITTVERPQDKIYSTDCSTGTSSI